MDAIVRETPSKAIEPLKIQYRINPGSIPTDNVAPSPDGTLSIITPTVST